MLSNSRIYIFQIVYKNKKWLDILDTNELSGLISNVLITGIEYFSFKNIQFINVFEDEKYSCEIHINKLKYKQRRVVDKDDIKILRNKIIMQLTKLKQLKYEQLHLVNDEFSKQPSAGFMTDEMFYV